MRSPSWRLSVPILLSLACTPTTTHVVQSSWRGEKPPSKPRKILVLAKITEPPSRDRLENELAAAISKTGVEAVAANAVLSPQDLSDAATLTARADQLGIDAMVRLVPGAPRTEIRQQPTVSMGVGVGVPVGFGGVGVGTSVPLAGGVTAERWIGVYVDFFQRDAQGPLWSAEVDAHLEGDMNQVIDTVSTLTAERMKKDKVL